MTLIKSGTFQGEAVRIEGEDDVGIRRSSDIVETVQVVAIVVREGGGGDDALHLRVGAPARPLPFSL